MKYLFSLIALLLLLNCSTTNSSNYSKIEYSAGACYGFCPIYKMTLNSDRTAIFKAERFNFSQDRTSEKSEGTFKATINEKEYAELLAILNNLKLSGLKDYYGNKNISDLPTSNLNITYQDGTVKNIEDYGKNGTPELEKLYQFFDELKTSQIWTKID